MVLSAEKKKDSKNKVNFVSLLKADKSCITNIKIIKILGQTNEMIFF